jgi:Ca2+-binding RTX toxin-like protein
MNTMTSQTVKLRWAVAFACCALAILPATALSRTMVGTPGKDRLIGGPRAANVINGDGGGDYITGGASADRLLGEWGGDDIYGRGGDDFLDGGSGGDLLDASNGNDWIVGGFGSDYIFAGDGNDFIDGGAAGDHINAGTGDDIVHGGTATDHIRGGTGNDTIYSDSGGDIIDAGPGSDVVFVNNSTAVDKVDCGRGNDTIHINPFAMRGGFSNRRSIKRHRIRNCETILETPRPADPTRGVKKLTRDRGGRAEGTERNDNLLGSFGPDVIIGLGGNDIIWANRKPTGTSHGTDRIDAGAGDDTVYGASRGGKTVMDGGAGNDYLQGGGVTSTNFIYGGPGADTVRLVGHGYNRVSAGEGDDIVLAYTKDRTKIDCGPGRDTVKIGKNKHVTTRHCESVHRR